MDERRYYGLDALRGGMMMLGIVLHGAMLYLSAPPRTMPIPTDRNTAYVFDLVFAFIHSFRMPAFFVLAGFFTSLLIEKRGVGGAYRDRALRVLAPLVVGAVTILPVTGLLMLSFMVSARFGTHAFVPDRASLQALGREFAAQGVPVDEPSLGHLWFLYYLCFFYLLIPGCRYLAARSLRVAPPVKRWLGSPLLLLGLALYTAATLWPFHGGQVHDGFILLTPHPPSLLYYGSFFVIGFVFHHHREILPLLARSVPTWVAIAVVMFPVAMYASDLDSRAGGSSVTLHLGAVLANGLCTWALIGLSVGCALRYFDRNAPWIIYVSQSSYWIFLIHMPLVCLAGWWLVQYDLAAPLKFLIVCGFAVTASALTFHYGVQRTWISAFLHGRRFDLDWPWRAKRAA